MVVYTLENLRIQSFENIFDSSVKHNTNIPIFRAREGTALLIN